MTAALQPFHGVSTPFAFVFEYWHLSTLNQSRLLQDGWLAGLPLFGLTATLSWHLYASIQGMPYAPSVETKKGVGFVLLGLRSGTPLTTSLFPFRVPQCVCRCSQATAGGTELAA